MYTLCYTELSPTGKENKFIIILGSHRLEKYLIIQDCLEKSLKIRFALKNTL